MNPKSAPTMANRPTTDLANISSSHDRLLQFLLVYRWVSILPTLWLFGDRAEAATPTLSPTLLLIFAVGSTLLVTISYIQLKWSWPNTPLWSGLDILLATLLLVYSGFTHSPYYFYALNLLLLGAYSFEMPTALLLTGTFTLLYLLALLVAQQIYVFTIQGSLLFAQLGGAWLGVVLFSSALTLFRQLHEVHKELAVSYDKLARQHTQLADAHQKLEVTHELTLFLQGSSRQTIQQRLLKAVTNELGFSRAVVGLVNPVIQRLERWQAYPHPVNRSAAPLLLLTSENDLITEAVLARQVRWSSEEQPLTTNQTLKFWLGHNHWLILPIVWQGQSVGVLLVAVETTGPVNIADDRWAILTSLISQAALALATINRAHQLAAEQERNRIARDIHDTVAQSLFGIVFTLDGCIKLLPQHVQTVQQELIELRKLANHIRQQVRQSILDNWPTELTQEQFKTDLGKYVARCAPAHVFNIDFNISGDFDGLPALIRRGLYRVCQEGLVNAAKHSGIDSARVYLYVEPAEIYLSIRDNGQGFDPKQIIAQNQAREQFGLRGIQERVHTLGGTCDILSQVGQGTQVLVRIPLDKGNGYE
jgi:signal transduction histidine kinase